ncbi:MAG: acyl-CoA dehydrogenase family protein [Candidatus Calescibacterium sp.]|nr:acyl-CoA dehydrogenase family protein [Candidatus Calescibacterium sp.]MDW8087061.1 acyl-CoA dehydrogenase family protein [Candidatus Calescibacterium sp.]
MKPDGINFNPPQEVRQIIDSMFKFIDNEIVPLEKENKKVLEDETKMYDENLYLKKEVQELRSYVRKKSAEAGFYTIFVPESLGGSGFGPLSSVFINIKLHARYGPGRPLITPGRGLLVSPLMAGFVDGPSSVIAEMTDELKKQVLPGLLKGEKTQCFALSEPEAGSDVWSMKTRAERKGKNWVINGIKQWITNGPYADYAVVFAVTDTELLKAKKGGITAFYVEKERGWKVQSIIPYMGHFGSDTAILSFDNVEVPESHVIGEVNFGFLKAMEGIDIGRLAIGAICSGLSEWALNESIEYSKQRKAFGQTISEYQAIQFMLADSYLDTYTSQTLCIHCGWLAENSEKPPIKEISAAKGYCVEACQRVFDRAIQIFGGMGLTNELRLQDGFRLARTYRIPDGTSEIQRRTIARRLLKGDTSVVF